MADRQGSNPASSGSARGRTDATGAGEITVSPAPLFLLATLMICLGWQGAYRPGGQLLLGVGLLATMAGWPIAPGAGPS